MQTDRKGLSKRQITVASLIVLASAVVAVVLVLQRQEYLERMEQTRAAASEIISETRGAFESIELLTKSEKSSLRRYRNKEHVQTAEKLGISGVMSRGDAKELAQDRQLVRIESNPLYHIQELDYSIPYLTPSASNLLDRIGHRFQLRLAELGLPPYRFVVTSVTRSREDQEALREVNINAAATSSHEFGTTFDLHYGEFDYDAQPIIPEGVDVYENELREMLSDAYSELATEYAKALKAVLGEVLLELQSDKDAMVIYERRQPVYHVTVSQPIPQAPPRLESSPRPEASAVSLSR